MYSAAKGFIGQPSMTSAPYAEGTGLYGWIDKTATKYPTTAKFISGFGSLIFKIIKYIYLYFNLKFM